MSYDGDSKLIDARDVLDVNARVRRGFVGRVEGYFKRIGPDPWDDYEYIEQTGEQAVEVYPGIKVQLEASGCAFRMRSMGKVQRVSWRPDEGEIERDGADPEGLRGWFVAHYVDAFDEKPGYGAAAVIADKLK